MTSKPFTAHPSLFTFPPSANFGRVLPKNKIYEHGEPSAAVKELFVRQVDQIVWQYKLAPETINVKGTAAVAEIQLFRIALKTGDLKTAVLHCIDQAIPFPILFELHYAERVKTMAAYKRPNEADLAKWVVSDYFESAWLPKASPRAPLPMVLDLDGLYAQLLTPLLPFPPHPGEALPTLVARMGLIRTKQRLLEKCAARLRQEKQFNRKIPLNAELRALQQEIAALTRPLVGTP